MSSQMENRMICAEFESLLSDALDGTLPAAAKAGFERHRAECGNCAVMFAETAAGMRWLDALPEVELPANFIHNVLAATSGAEPRKAKATTGNWWERLRTALPKTITPVLQPRFAMSFGMAFFSITMILNVAGFKLGDLRHVDLRPSALVRTYYEASGRVVKYYENIRVVYEIESRVQELKRATTPESETPADKDRKNRNDHSGNPDRKYQNYSREEGRPVMARYAPHSFPTARGSYGLPPDPESTFRRLS